MRRIITYTTFLKLEMEKNEGGSTLPPTLSYFSYFLYQNDPLGTYHTFSTSGFAKRRAKREIWEREREKKERNSVGLQKPREIVCGNRQRGQKHKNGVKLVWKDPLGRIFWSLKLQSSLDSSSGLRFRQFLGHFQAFFWDGRNRDILSSKFFI